MSGNVLFVPHNGEAMNETQLRAALSGLNEAHPARQAIAQLIAAAMAAAVVDASDPKLDPTKGTHAGGRIEALANLRAELEGLWGQVPEDEPDES